MAAQQARLLAVVDDTQWLDAPSLECVRYAARRASGRVAFAVAERAEAGEGREGMAVLVVPPLDLPESLEVLARVAPDLSPGVARALAHAAEGNPLALVELPATLNGGQRSGGVVLPAPITPGRQLQAVFSG